MTDRVTPPWEVPPGTPLPSIDPAPKVAPAAPQGAQQGEQPNRRRGYAWTKGMPSPNPKGRPKGIVDKRLRVSQALLDAAEGVARKVIEEALDGDMSASALVLARAAPALKAQAEKVQFDFDAKASLVEQVQSVLQGVADGQVAPDVGRNIIESIAALSSIKSIEELETRLARLEGKR